MPHAESAEDSQESQEYFGMDDMNYDDPELVAALDPENAAKAQELKQKDEAVCEVSNSAQVTQSELTPWCRSLPRTSLRPSIGL